MNPSSIRVRRLFPRLLFGVLLAASGAHAQKPLLTPVQPGGAARPSAPAADDPLQVRLAALETRLGRLEKVFENQVVRELLRSVDALQLEIRELRGEIENQYNDLEVLQKRQRDLYRDNDRRLRELEVGMTSGATGGVTSGLPEAPPVGTGAGAQAKQPAVAAVAPAVAAGDEEQEKAAYVAAFEFLKTGQYGRAIKEYGAFLGKYPNGRYADNAQYWLGEANYVSREFPEALSQFQKVVANFPASPKVADARLKIGFAFYEMERYDDARQALEDVVRDYPDSSVARLARQRIVRMKEEGR